jgi:hypothetical protein
VIGYRFDDIKKESLQEGTTTAALQWKDLGAIYGAISLLFSCLFYTSFFVLGLLNFGDSIYQTGERRQVLFDFIDAFLSLVGDIVTLIALIVALVRRPEEIMKDLKFLCSKCASCLRIRKSCCSTSDKPAGSPTCCCCSGKNGTETVRGLSSTGRKALTVIANFSEIFLSLFDEILATIILITSLYSFMGEQNFRTFYGITEWTEVPSMMLILLSFLLYLKSHYDRAENIFGNVFKFDKDILNASKAHTTLSKIINPFTLLAGFQWRIVLHTVLLSFLQIVCLLALAWKIIRDTCQSPTETQILDPALSFWVELGLVETPTSQYGPLGNCTLPSLSPDKINFYTVYSILYVSIILPIMSYLLLFVSNLPYFISYSQLLHLSGLYQAEHGPKEGGMGDISGNMFRKVLKIFYNEQMHPSGKKVSDADIEQLRIRRGLVESDYVESSNRSSEKARAIVTSVPTVMIGVVHFALFFTNIGFLACRYSPQLGVTCSSPSDMFHVFTTSLERDEIALIVPLIILFLLVGLPGALITLMWICVFVIILTVVAVYCTCYILTGPPKEQRRRRY